MRFIRDLARKHNSPALAKLATRLASSVRLAAHSGDIVSKVKGLINYVIDKLESEGDMQRYTFCDKEPSESNAKIHELEIGEQVAALQKDLAALATSRGVRGVVRVLVDIYWMG